MQNLFTGLAHVAGSLTNRSPARTQPVNTAPVPFVGTSPFLNNGGQISGDAEYGAFGSVGTLFAIVTALDEKVASAEWHLYRKTSVRDKSRRQEVTVHGFLNVWENPNEFMTGQYFREATNQHLELVGEAVIVLHVVGGLVIEMWPVRPDRIVPVKHPTKFLTGYIYFGPDGEQVPLSLDQVIHIKRPNPKDPYRGMGPVQTVLNDIDAARFSAEWNKNFFLNGAQPGGVIKVDYRMTDTEFREFIARWRSQHQGVANAHRVAVLENAEWQDTKFTMQDMQFAELRNLPRELIREAFAFPKPMLGTVDDVNRANSDAAKEIMAENHIIPRLRRWKDVINSKLLPRFANGKTLELDFDDPTPKNYEQEDAERTSKTKAAQALVLSGYHPDDAAQAVGLPPMRWVGIPAPVHASSDDPSEGDDETARTPKRVTATRIKRELPTGDHGTPHSDFSAVYTSV